MAERLINKTVRLSREQIEALQEEGKRDHRDLSALVRIAVDELLQARRVHTRQPELQFAGGNGR